MPQFYCEYCGIYLTHSSPSGRAQHGKGRQHIQNRVQYYKQVIMEQENDKDGTNKGGFLDSQKPGAIINTLATNPNLAIGLQQGGIMNIASHLNAFNPNNPLNTLRMPGGDMNLLSGLKPNQNQLPLPGLPNLLSGPLNLNNNNNNSNSITGLPMTGGPLHIPGLNRM